MKKRLLSIVLVVVLIAACTSNVFAGETIIESDFGIKNITIENSFKSNVVITPQLPDKTAVTKTSVNNGDSLYFNAERMQIEYNAGLSAAGKDYMVFVLKSGGSTVPTQGNIVYLNQTKADASGKVSFNVYPSELDPSIGYDIYFSTNASATDDPILKGEYTKVASYGCYENYHYVSTYTLGDVNEDGRINSTDASMALRIGALIETDVSQSQRLAADVNGDNRINASDASYILQRAALLITDWPINK